MRGAIAGALSAGAVITLALWSTRPAMNDAAPASATHAAEAAPGASSRATSTSGATNAGDVSVDRAPSRVTASDSTRRAPAPLALPPVSADAADSLAAALRDGDPRSPPIVHDPAPAQAPAPAERYNPVAYRRYEARQRQRVYEAFAAAADAALVEQARDLTLARAQGAPAEVLAEGEDKQRHLAQTLQRLREGRLGTPASPPADAGD
jgi:hypothetical protein